MDTLAQRKGITISFIIISSFFFLFAIIALVIVIIKGKREAAGAQDYSELEN
jgi:heme/copper-type cytochrome/quinol oxidase subunit 2